MSRARAKGGMWKILRNDLMGESVSELADGKSKVRELKVWF